ncbi:6286_t:CDS:2 [Diversispora eburnea]|uniref:6286_t:CDS:1 n=1 Tax=Diversispora eburnea TaxID=1213867 RepID=A0A9N8V0S3_9GLOM|nr:6286_t:CDS:2 [Diversispora eburnea]
MKSFSSFSSNDIDSVQISDAEHRVSDFWCISEFETLSNAGVSLEFISEEIGDVEHWLSICSEISEFEVLSYISDAEVSLEFSVSVKMVLTEDCETLMWERESLKSHDFDRERCSRFLITINGQSINITENNDFRLIVFSVHVNAICEHYGSNCPQDSPCCNKGWCSNDINLKIKKLADFTGDPNEADWTSDFTPDNSATDGNNLLLNMKLDTSKKNEFGNYQGFGATVSSTRWMLYGTVTARIKSGSSSLGVVSSFVVSNNTVSTIGDEIDLEWVGLNTNEVQTNYYWHGVIDYTKGEKIPVGADASKDFHTYTIDWQPELLSWYVDGKLVRQVTKESTYDQGAKVYKYPSEPSRISFSLWDGGEGAKGTADWAGTPTDWSDPNKMYTMAVDWVNITCFQQDTSFTWPPQGYGPQGNSTQSSSGSPSSNPEATDSPTFGNNSTYDYNNSSKKLSIPIGIIGVIVVVGSIFLI